VECKAGADKRGWLQESRKLTLACRKNGAKVLETEWALNTRSLEENKLKKSLIAVLAGVLLLSAAMPAFAKKHHHRHHHHHAQHMTQSAQ
jgi:hypothetical protein